MDGIASQDPRKNRTRQQNVITNYTVHLSPSKVFSSQHKSTPPSKKKNKAIIIKNESEDSYDETTSDGSMARSRPIARNLRSRNPAPKSSKPKQRHDDDYIVISSGSSDSDTSEYEPSAPMLLRSKRSTQRPKHPKTRTQGKKETSEAGGPSSTKSLAASQLRKLHPHSKTNTHNPKQPLPIVIDLTQEPFPQLILPMATVVLEPLPRSSIIRSQKKGASGYNSCLPSTGHAKKVPAELPSTVFPSQKKLETGGESSLLPSTGHAKKVPVKLPSTVFSSQKKLETGGKSSLLPSSGQSAVKNAAKKVRSRHIDTSCVGDNKAESSSTNGQNKARKSVTPPSGDPPKTVQSSPLSDSNSGANFKTPVVCKIRNQDITPPSGDVSKSTVPSSADSANKGDGSTKSVTLSKMQKHPATPPSGGTSKTTGPSSADTTNKGDGSTKSVTLSKTQKHPATPPSGNDPRMEHSSSSATPDTDEDDVNSPESIKEKGEATSSRSTAKSLILSSTMGKTRHRSMVPTSATPSGNVSAPGLRPLPLSSGNISPISTGDKASAGGAKESPSGNASPILSSATGSGPPGSSSRTLPLSSGNISPISTEDNTPAGGIKQSPTSSGGPSTSSATVPEKTSKEVLSPLFGKNTSQTTSPRNPESQKICNEYMKMIESQRNLMPERYAPKGHVSSNTSPNSQGSFTSPLQSESTITLANQIEFKAEIAGASPAGVEANWDSVSDKTMPANDLPATEKPLKSRLALTSSGRQSIKSETIPEDHTKTDLTVCDRPAPSSERLSKRFQCDARPNQVATPQKRPESRIQPASDSKVSSFLFGPSESAKMEKNVAIRKLFPAIPPFSPKKPPPSSEIIDANSKKAKSGERRAASSDISRRKETPSDTNTKKDKSGERRAASIDISRRKETPSDKNERSRKREFVRAILSSLDEGVSPSKCLFVSSSSVTSSSRKLGHNILHSTHRPKLPLNSTSQGQSRSENEGSTKQLSITSHKEDKGNTKESGIAIHNTKQPSIASCKENEGVTKGSSIASNKKTKAQLLEAIFGNSTEMSKPRQRATRLRTVSFNDTESSDSLKSTMISHTTRRTSMSDPLTPNALLKSQSEQRLKVLEKLRKSSSSEVTKTPQQNIKNVVFSEKAPSKTTKSTSSQAVAMTRALKTKDYLNHIENVFNETMRKRLSRKSPSVTSQSKSESGRNLLNSSKSEKSPKSVQNSQTNVQTADFARSLPNLDVVENALPHKNGDLHQTVPENVPAIRNQHETGGGCNEGNRKVQHDADQRSKMSQHSPNNTNNASSESTKTPITPKSNSFQAVSAATRKENYLVDIDKFLLETMKKKLAPKNPPVTSQGMIEPEHYLLNNSNSESAQTEDQHDQSTNSPSNASGTDRSHFLLNSSKQGGAMHQENGDLHQTAPKNIHHKHEAEGLRGKGAGNMHHDSNQPSKCSQYQHSGSTKTQKYSLTTHDRKRSTANGAKTVKSNGHQLVSFKNDESPDSDANSMEHSSPKSTVANESPSVHKKITGSDCDTIFILPGLPKTSLKNFKVLGRATVSTKTLIEGAVKNSNCDVKSTSDKPRDDSKMLTNINHAEPSLTNRDQSSHHKFAQNPDPTENNTQLDSSANNLKPPSGGQHIPVLPTIPLSSDLGESLLISNGKSSENCTLASCDNARVLSSVPPAQVVNKDDQPASSKVRLLSISDEYDTAPENVPYSADESVYLTVDESTHLSADEDQESDGAHEMLGNYFDKQTFADDILLPEINSEVIITESGPRLVDRSIHETTRYVPIVSSQQNPTADVMSQSVQSDDGRSGCDSLESSESDDDEMLPPSVRIQKRLKRAEKAARQAKALFLSLSPFPELFKSKTPAKHHHEKQPPVAKDKIAPEPYERNLERTLPMERRQESLGGDIENTLDDTRRKMKEKQAWQLETPVHDPKKTTDIIVTSQPERILSSNSLQNSHVVSPGQTDGNDIAVTMTSQRNDISDRTPILLKMLKESDRLGQDSNKSTPIHEVQSPPQSPKSLPLKGDPPTVVTHTGLSVLAAPPADSITIISDSSGDKNLRPVRDSVIPKVNNARKSPDRDNTDKRLMENYMALYEGIQNNVVYTEEGDDDDVIMPQHQRSVSESTMDIIIVGDNGTYVEQNTINPDNVVYIEDGDDEVVIPRQQNSINESSCDVIIIPDDVIVGDNGTDIEQNTVSQDKAVYAEDGDDEVVIPQQQNSINESPCDIIMVPDDVIIDDGNAVSPPEVPLPKSPAPPSKPNLFDLNEFFDDDDDLDNESEDEDDLPEMFLQEDLAEFTRKRPAPDDGDADELPDFPETPSSKRRRLQLSQESQDSTSKLHHSTIEMLSNSIESIHNNSLDNGNWLEGTSDDLNDTMRSRLRVLEPRSKELPKNVTAVLEDNTFSEAYKKHGASLRKLVKDKLRENKIAKMEESLKADMKRGFHRILDDPEETEEGIEEHDEATKKAMSLMKKDWGMLPRVVVDSDMIRKGGIGFCQHTMSLDKYFTEDELKAFQPNIKARILSCKLSGHIQHRTSIVQDLLDRPATRGQTVNWMVDGIVCRHESQEFFNIIHSKMKNSKESLINFQQFKTLLCRAGIKQEILDICDTEDGSRRFDEVCQKCQHISRRRWPGPTWSVLKIVSHASIIRESTSVYAEYVTLLLLALHEVRLARSRLEITALIMKTTEAADDWDKMKFLIAHQLLDAPVGLEVLKDVVINLDAMRNRAAELSRIIAFSTLTFHIHGTDISRDEDLNNLETYIGLVVDFNPANMEANLGEGEGEINTEKRAFYHMSLLLPMLAICFGRECKDPRSSAILDRMLGCLRVMMKRIRDNGLIYRSQVKYELTAFTKALRSVVQRAPKANKSSIFKYLRAPPVQEEVVNASFEEATEADQETETSKIRP